MLLHNKAVQGDPQIDRSCYYVLALVRSAMRAFKITHLASVIFTQEWSRPFIRNYTEWGVYIYIYIYIYIPHCNHISSVRFVIKLFVYGVGVGRCTVLAIWCRPVQCIG